MSFVRVSFDLAVGVVILSGALSQLGTGVCVLLLCTLTDRH